jgi:hypothetical protein
MRLINYIEMFMKHNFISKYELFAIRGSKKYADTDKIFYFDDKYNLKSDSIEREHNSIFLRLLAGTYSIIIDVG